jgi:hypothetical protein
MAIQVRLMSPRSDGASQNVVTVTEEVFYQMEADMVNGTTNAYETIPGPQVTVNWGQTRLTRESPYVGEPHAIMSMRW